MSQGVALITGITGQDGSYLAGLLLEKGYEVHGMVRRSSTETFGGRPPPRPREAPPGGPPRPELPGPPPPGDAALRGLQPGGPVVRPDLLVPAHADRRVHRPGRDPGAGRDPPGRRGHPLLSGIQLRDVRQGAGDAAERGDALLPRSPYGVAKVYGHWITVNYRESLQPLRVSPGILFNHESPATGSREFVTRKVTHGGREDQAGAPGREAHAREPSMRSADWGYSPETTSRRCGSCSSRINPADYVVATGETHSVARDGSTIAFARVGLRPWTTIVDPRSGPGAPGRGGPPGGRPGQGPGGDRLALPDLVPRPGADHGRRGPGGPGAGERSPARCSGHR